MLPIPRIINDIRPHYGADSDLLRTIMNSMSWIEATLAVSLAAESVPERQLVNMANIREALKELPRCPRAMPVDFETLARVWDLVREGNGWERSFEDSAGDYTVVLLGEGNYCYDIVIRTAHRTYMWMPRNVEEDFVNPEIVDLLIERSTLLANVVDLAEAMGLVFSPLFYLSLDDWRQEYASTVFSEVVESFCTEDAADERLRRSRATWVAEVRKRCMVDHGVTWVG